MTINKITTHATDAQARLPSLLSRAENLNAMIAILAGRVQDVENMLFDLLTKRMLDAAEGQQLDVLGLHVGEQRLGRSDADYVDAIGVRILVNTSNGTEPRLLAIARLFGDAVAVEIIDAFPASMIVNITESGGDLSRLASLLRDAKSAGVGLTPIQITANPFTMSAVLEFGTDGAHIADDEFTSAGSTFLTEGVAAGDVLWIYAPQSDSGPHVVDAVISETKLKLTVAFGTTDTAVSFDVRRNDIAGAGVAPKDPPIIGTDGAHVANDEFESAGSLFITGSIAPSDRVWIYRSQVDAGVYVVVSVESETKLRVTPSFTATDSGVVFDVRTSALGGELSRVVT